MSDARIDIIGPQGAVSARLDAASRLLVDATGFETLTGWQVKPVGLCRAEMCIPLPAADAIGPPGDLDLVALCDAGHMPVVVDADAGVGVIGTAAEQRRDELRGRAAPVVELPDLDGARRSVVEGSGKRMIVAFASWCGCAFDLPSWQLLADELADDDFTIVGVAVDESADLVEPFTEKIDFPVLVDADREFCEAYGIVNVPTVVWVDEAGDIARPNLQAFSDDVWVEVHGKESGPHLDALRRWVRDDELPDIDVDELRPSTTAAEQLARTEFRLGIELRRRGHAEAARTHIERASELAPDDFTIWRAGLQLTGDDPFGPEFFARYDRWKERTGGYSYPGDLPEGGAGAAGT